MNTKIADLLKALNEAEQAAIERINSRIPRISVPDEVAIPILDRLEAEQRRIEESFAAVRHYLTLLKRRRRH